MNKPSQLFTFTALLLVSGNAFSSSLSSPSSSSSSYTSSSSSLHYGDTADHYLLSDEGMDEEKRKEEEEEDLWASMNLSGGGGVDVPPQNNTVVLAQVGGGATFTCHTHHLSDEMVTWLKRDDDQLLTVGSQVYAAENRFTASHSNHKAWELWVKDVQLSDAGQYECQLTTHPPVTFHFTLKVTQAEAVVSGPSEVHIEEGSKLALECHVRLAASPPVYIFWYHNNTMVNYARQDSLEVQHHNYTSNLVVSRVRASDAGTYTCEPHLATPANVTVHVFTGKTPAAMQHGRNQVDGGASTLSPVPYTHLSTALLLTVMTWATLTSPYSSVSRL